MVYGKAVINIMVKESKKEKSEGTGFYEQLFKKVSLTAIVVIALSLSYILWAGAEFDSPFLPILIVGLALVKTVFIVRLTFNQLTKIIGESHQLTHVLTVFTVLIILIVLSFSADYHALYILSSENFKSEALISGSVLVQFFDFMYFSLITFSSVGYGDIDSPFHCGQTISNDRSFLELFGPCLWYCKY